MKFGRDAPQEAACMNGLSSDSQHGWQQSWTVIFGGTAFQEVVAVNGLSIPVNDSNQSVLSCSIAQEVREGGMVNRSTNFLSCCMGMALTGSHL